MPREQHDRRRPHPPGDHDPTTAFSRVLRIAAGACLVLAGTGVRFVLGRQPGITVVGEAATGTEALRLADELDPDVVVMDLAMPGIGGLAATRQLTEAGARARVLVLVLTMSEDDGSVLATLRAGAAGHLVTGAGPDQLASAMGRGRRARGSRARSGRPGAGRRRRAARSGPAGPAGALRAREGEFLALLADGLTNAGIGRALFISPITVRNHVSRILAELQVTDRRQATLRSRAIGAPRRS